jgi:hypothetical protein
MTEAQVAPVLAVVGHPNKGKSSLVSSLAQDDSVGIGADPGTTLRARAYPMRVDGALLYTLVDTPGFQRARKVLAILNARSHNEGASAADRARLVKEFVEDAGHASRFPDECELLRPIVEGAGILYVVDGGVPYGPEYEAEMEILRWTGAPSMAIINPIASDKHVAPWRAALSQFFRVVRVIDAVAADFATRRQLLLAFGEIESSWRAPIEAAVAALDDARRTQQRFAAREIAEFIANSLCLVVERKISRNEDPAQYSDALEAEYKTTLETFEDDHRRAVQRVYDHHTLEAHAANLELLEQDLFSEDTWLTFGLRRRDLVTAGVASGVATGAVVDAALPGISLLLGMAAGGVLGGVLGWLGAGRLAELNVVNRPLGGKLARFGPSKNVNFPFVLLGRARLHALLVAERTHAMRAPIEIGNEPAERLPLVTASRKKLEKTFAALRRPGLGAAEKIEQTDQLQEIVEDLIANVDANLAPVALRSIRPSRDTDA